MMAKYKDVRKYLGSIRSEFPILERCTYLNFYTTDEEIDIFFQALEDIYRTGEHQGYSDRVGHVM